MPTSTGKKIIHSINRGEDTSEDIKDYSENIKPIVEDEFSNRGFYTRINTMNNALEIQNKTKADLGVAIEDINKAKQERRGFLEKLFRRTEG